MEQRIPLKALRLWWPAWQCAIPFKAYGYGGVRKECSGEGYKFFVDPELDSWVLLNDSAAQCPYPLTSPQLMPVSGARLEDCDEGPIDFTSFTIMGDGTVQVNYKVPGTEGYHIDFYPIECLSMVGEVYSDADDD